MDELGETQATSPRLLCLAADDKRLEQLVDGSWSRDASVCVYTRGAIEELVPALQQFARRQMKLPAGNQLARLTPASLAHFLANSPPDAVASLLEHADAVFLETHQGDRWAVFSSRDFGTALQMIGLEPTPPWRS